MKRLKKIKGAGGGGKGSGDSAHVATEAADSLQSQAYAQVIDLISEGEIGGLFDGLKSVFLDGTPIENDDGTFNFKNLIVQHRVGTQDQDYVAGFEAVENEIDIETEVKSATPIVKTITNSNIDAARIRISFPQLTFQNPSTGDLTGNQVNIAIDLQSNGGGFLEQLSDTVKGKSTSKYEKSYRIQLIGDPPWDIRVRKLTTDATTTNDQKRVIFESYTEIEDLKLRYPNSAIVGVRIDSSQFQSIPSRAYDIRGLKVKVPVNYDPVLRTYDGAWDGTFQVDYTDNPAWIFYDLLTSTRYGIGQFIPEAQVDKWGLYEISKYCDEFVDDGFGSIEPRFTCNLYLQSRADAYKVLQDLSSVFRGMIYWAGGIISVSQDAPADAIALFTAANVIDGMFTYSGASSNARHTVALVSWNDPEDFYKQKVEYVEDFEGILKYGQVESSVIAFGCTSRGQANRIGRWILFTEKFQTETVTFQSGLEAAPIRPGHIIKVADQLRSGSRRGGRLLTGSTVNSLIMDAAVNAAASDMTISVILPDGSIEEKSVNAISGNVVSLQSDLSQVPQAGAIWIASTTTVEPQQFRVIGMTEPKPGIFEITALQHNPDKFAAVEDGLILEARNISDLSTVPPSPQNVTITETLYSVGSDVRVKVTCSWDQVPGVSGYLVQWQRDSQNPIVLPQTSSTDIEILNAEPGTYTFFVTAINSAGTKSVPSQVTAVVLGRGAAPIDVDGFSMLPVAGQAYLSWNQSTDLDVLIGGSIRIRYSPDIVSPRWKDSVDVVPALPGTATRTTAPLLTGTYMAKFVDSSDNPSINEAIIITTIPSALALNVVDSFSEDPTWAGVMDNMQYLPAYGGILIASAILFDDIVSLDDEIIFDFPGGVAEEGTYYFANTVDLGGVYTSKLTAAIAVSAVDVTDSIDERLELMDDWRDLDGEFIDDVNSELWVRTTTDDPSSSPTWTDWKRFFVGEYSFRAAQFKLISTSGNTQHNVSVTGLSIGIDMEDRVINDTAIVSGAGAKVITFVEPFKTTPTIGITADAMNSGDYYQLTSKTNTGFTITFYNSSAVAISRTFDWLAKGYGRKVA